jgi:hypothetical protein
MDSLSLATALSAAQLGRAQMALADAATSIVQVIEAAQQNFANLGNVPAEIGRNLNITV